MTTSAWSAPALQASRRSLHRARRRQPPLFCSVRWPTGRHDGLFVMLTLCLVGIGCGDPAQLTLAAIRAINAADLVLIPRKGLDKSDLADLRRTICGEVLTNQATRVVEFDLPKRDAVREDYKAGVDAW